MQHEHVEQALSPVEHLYKNFLKLNCKIFNPSIPRYLFGSCCLDLAHGPNIRMRGHGEKMVGEHCRIRNNPKSILLKDGVRNMRVLDTLGTLTSNSTVSERGYGYRSTGHNINGPNINELQINCSIDQLLYRST
jgi:hypothetical protein